MFKSIFSAFIATTLTIVPGFTRVEEETGELLRLLADTGIPVVINDSPHCESGNYLGMYEFAGMKRSVHLCPGDSVDAIDHATVRHEAWHAIQHCVNVARGTSVDKPIISMDDLVKSVNENLPQDMVTAIKRAYPQDQWPVEFEAFVAQETMTATDIIKLYKEACLADY